MGSYVSQAAAATWSWTTYNVPPHSFTMGNGSSPISIGICSLWTGLVIGNKPAWGPPSLKKQPLSKFLKTRLLLILWCTPILISQCPTKQNVHLLPGIPQWDLVKLRGSGRAPVALRLCKLKGENCLFFTSRGKCLLFYPFNHWNTSYLKICQKCKPNQFTLVANQVFPPICFSELGEMGLLEINMWHSACCDQLVIKWEWFSLICFQKLCLCW